MTDAHGFVLPPLLQTSMEISLLAIAMILLLAPKDRRLPEAITMIYRLPLAGSDESSSQRPARHRAGDADRVDSVPCEGITRNP